jgi:hypothetical protein
LGKFFAREWQTLVGKIEFGAAQPALLMQALAIGWVQVDGDASAHPEDSHAGKLVGIPQRTLMSASIH